VSVQVKPEVVPVKTIEKEEPQADDFKIDIDINVFPSPLRLRQYNEQLLQQRGHKNKANRSKDGRLHPGPSSKNRDEIFTRDDLARFDNLASSVSIIWLIIITKLIFKFIIESASENNVE